MHNLAIGGLIFSTIGLAITNVVDAASANGIIATGTTLSTLGVPALLGIIAIASTFGLVKVFLLQREDSKANAQALTDLVKSNTEAIARLTSSVDQQNRAVERLDNVVTSCPKR